MSSSDGSNGAHFHDPHPPGERPRRSGDSRLVEALIHVLIEKGVLTKNDSLSIVQTVAMVTEGAADDGAAGAQAAADLQMLQRLFASFEALDDHASAPSFDNADNVQWLRPPLHGERPEFPKRD